MAKRFNPSTQAVAEITPAPQRSAPWFGSIEGASPRRAIARGEKAWRLMRLLAQDPTEFADRIRAMGEIQARKRWPTPVRYSPVSWQEMVQQVSAVLDPQMPWEVDDAGFVQMREQIAGHLRPLKEVPFPAYMDGDMALARICYFLTLALKPEVVIETGVALGIVSSFILSAMERNRRGRLVSIDLPPLGVRDNAIGLGIPHALRARWVLHRGASARVLPRLLAELPQAGLFVHDSLFTRRNSRHEYALVLPHLANRSAIVANRVDFSDAFAWLAATTAPAATAVVRAEGKDDFIGVAVYDRYGSRIT